ncbi:hypothetical protein LWI28_009253 [Acer negundo]|uniref:Disease resistance R13L4/SHOC-2-like LRR domain-containing protein n=1 Tax=Acer negundo TaxID=4023 RepID=A0AAD5IDY7_ACENE|nr:hypothetical protein LWI28_009253 [Acer negundo]
MINRGWVEGDVGPMLMVCLDFITINDDPKPELVEDECHAAPKVYKEASLGIGDQSAPKFNNIKVLDSGNTTEEHGSAMVVTIPRNLKEIPQGIGKLINLRHLRNDGILSLRYMSKGIEKLTCLRTLDEFHLSGSDYSSEACSIECLNQFCHLEGYLCMSGLRNLTNVSEAGRIQLTNKKNIYKLALPNLIQLSISVYASTVLPNWMTSLTNLRSIRLTTWINSQQLPPLGKVSSLESIFIRGMEIVKRLGNELLGLESDDITSSLALSATAFPKLKSLFFLDMKEWEEWDFGNEDDNITILFSSLRFLDIYKCPKLKVLPKQILQAPLKVLSINQCTVLSNHYRKGTGGNWSDISHIPNIKIDDEYVHRDGRELTRTHPTPGKVYDQEVNTWVEMPVGMGGGWLVREAGTKLSVTVEGELYALDPSTALDSAKI